VAKSAKEPKTIASAPVGSEGKTKALSLAVDQIEKQFGKGAIMSMGESQHVHVETFSTGSISLDIALGGGIPKGGIIMIGGQPGVGKTVLSQQVMFHLARQGGRGDTLLGGELGKRHTRAPLHQPQERRLSSRDPELFGLLAKLPRETQQDGSQLGCDQLRTKDNLANH